MKKQARKSHEKIFPCFKASFLFAFSIFAGKSWNVRSEMKMMFCVKECRTGFSNVSLTTSTRAPAGKGKKKTGIKSIISEIYEPRCWIKIHNRVAFTFTTQKLYLPTWNIHEFEDAVVVHTLSIPSVDFQKPRRSPKTHNTQTDIDKPLRWHMRSSHIQLLIRFHTQKIVS